MSRLRMSRVEAFAATAPSSSRGSWSVVVSRVTNPVQVVPGNNKGGGIWPQPSLS
jgi:hypothetical protein